MLATRDSLRGALAIVALATAVAVGPSRLTASEPLFSGASGRTSVHSSGVGERDRRATPTTLFQWSTAPQTAGGLGASMPLVADRPRFTNSPFTVGRGAFQLEFGYTYTFDDQGHESARTHSLGEPFLRYGVLADWLELRLNLNPLARQSRTPHTSERTAGTDDLLVGVKFALTPQQGVLPAMALIPEAAIPTGSSGFTSDAFRPRLTWAYSWDVTDRLGVAGNTILSRSIETTYPDGLLYGTIEGMSPGQEAYTEVAQSLAVNYRLTERLGSFYEWYGLFPHSGVTVESEHYFDTGLTWLIFDNVQWDIRAGWGLNEAADDFFAGTGLSIRFR